MLAVQGLSEHTQPKCCLLKRWDFAMCSLLLWVSAGTQCHVRVRCSLVQVKDKEALAGKWAQEIEDDAADAGVPLSLPCACFFIAMIH